MVEARKSKKKFSVHILTVHISLMFILNKSISPWFARIAIIDKTDLNLTHEKIVKQEQLTINMLMVMLKVTKTLW